MGAFMVLAFLAAVAGTVLSLMYVTPESRRDQLNKYLQIAADIFNFKGLLLEYILKTLYIFLTLFSILAGFFCIFGLAGDMGFGAALLTGLLIMIVTPIVLRLIFESFMQFIILVKNVIQINNKLPDKKD